MEPRVVNVVNVPGVVSLARPEPVQPVDALGFPVLCGGSPGTSCGVGALADVPDAVTAQGSTSALPAVVHSVVLACRAVLANRLGV